MKCSHLLAACLTIMMALPTAWGQSVSKEKKYSGHFPASKGRLLIDNRYGKLTINTGDQSTVTVDITVKAKARTAANAQDLLDKVSITEPGDQATGISYKTIVGPGKSYSDKSELSIDYVINMPRRHTATFINKYGDIEISNVDGKLEIDLQYGKLTTGTFRGNDKDIKVGYGSATIQSIETGSIAASYSKLSIIKAGDIQVSNQYEKTTIGTVRDLDVEQKYGNLVIGEVTKLKANAQFASMSVDKLLKSLQMNLRYCSRVKFGYVDSDVDNIRVQSSYSNQSYHFDKGTSLSGEIALTYGNLSDGTGTFSLSKTSADRTGNNTIYKVTAGSGRGNISLSSSYGNIVFR